MTALHPSNPYYSLARSPDTLHATDSVSGPADRRQAYAASRSASIATSTPSAPSNEPASTAYQQRKASTSSQQPRILTTYRTRSIGFGGVYFERDLDTSPPNDDEIIIVTARVTNSFRRASVEQNSELPARPRKRSFLRRVSTRVSSPTDACRYTALKMPRKDYKKFFARDRDGNYAGTEPEKEWSDEDLQKMFGQYQDMPLRSIPGGYEYGEGAPCADGEEGAAVGGAQSGVPADTISGRPMQGDGLDQMRAWGGFQGGNGETRESLI